MLLNKSVGSGGAKPGKKTVNKSFENLGGHLKLKSNNGSQLVDLQLPKTTMAHQTNRSNRGGKNSTLSTSPKRRDVSQPGTLGGSANY